MFMCEEHLSERAILHFILVEWEVLNDIGIAINWYVADSGVSRTRRLESKA